MEFAAPSYGWLAVAVPLVAYLELRSQRSRERLLARFAEPRLLAMLIKPEGRTIRLFRVLLPAVVTFLLVLALMRPQWGLVEEEQRGAGIDIVFALDLSRSMLADDVPPSRLAAAKNALCDMLDACRGDRTGLIGFAGTAFLICPVTTDYEMVKSLVKEVGPQTLPKGGSSLSSALREARRAFRGAAPGGRMLVLLSDGEDQSEDTASAIADLRKEGIMTVAFAVGTPAGGVMPLAGGSFVKDRNGAVVKSRAELQRLRLVDGSASFLSGGGLELSRRLAGLRARLRETSGNERRQQAAERYYLPLGAALLIWFGFALCTRGRGLP